MTGTTRAALIVGVALLASACGGGGTPATTPSRSIAPPSSGSASPGSASPGGTNATPSAAVGPVNPAPVVEGKPYRPALPDPADFVAVIDNPYLPFVPGTTSVYEGVSEGQRERNVVVVTHRIKVILGVRTTVVHDQVFARGELAENTFDWYAQDRFGNVWYFGEDTAEYANGKVVNTDGTWQAGVDGAQAGIAMLGAPVVGETYRQEYYPGQAEDTGTIVALDGTVDVPYGSFDRILKTEDATRLQPQLLENKFYAPGIGVVLERTIAGGQEISRLVAFTSAG